MNSIVIYLMDIMLLVHTQQNEQIEDEIQAGLLYASKNGYLLLWILRLNQELLFFFFWKQNMWDLRNIL